MAARYGRMVWFLTATNAMMLRSGTNGVDRTPSTWFFLVLVCRSAISCW